MTSRWVKMQVTPHLRWKRREHETCSSVSQRIFWTGAVKCVPPARFIQPTEQTSSKELNSDFVLKHTSRQCTRRHRWKQQSFHGSGQPLNTIRCWSWRLTKHRAWRLSYKWFLFLFQFDITICSQNPSAKWLNAFLCKNCTWLKRRECGDMKNGATLLRTRPLERNWLCGSKHIPESTYSLSGMLMHHKILTGRSSVTECCQFVVAWMTSGQIWSTFSQECFAHPWTSWTAKQQCHRNIPSDLMELQMKVRSVSQFRLWLWKRNQAIMGLRCFSYRHTLSTSVEQDTRGFRKNCWDTLRCPGNTFVRKTSLPGRNFFLVHPRWSEHWVRLKQLLWIFVRSRKSWLEGAKFLLLFSERIGHPLQRNQAVRYELSFIRNTLQTSLPGEKHPHVFSIKQVDQSWVHKRSTFSFWHKGRVLHVDLRGAESVSHHRLWTQRVEQRETGLVVQDTFQQDGGKLLPSGRKQQSVRGRFQQQGKNADVVRFVRTVSWQQKPVQNTQNIFFFFFSSQLHEAGSWVQSRSRLRLFVGVTQLCATQYTTFLYTCETTLCWIWMWSTTTTLTTWKWRSQCWLRTDTRQVFVFSFFCNQNQSHCLLLGWTITLMYKDRSNMNLLFRLRPGERRDRLHHLQPGPRACSERGVHGDSSLVLSCLFSHSQGGILHQRWRCGKWDGSQAT